MTDRLMYFMITDLTTQAGITGETVTCYVAEINKSTGARSLVINGATATECGLGLDGIYFVIVPDIDLKSYEYAGVGQTVDYGHVAGLRWDGADAWVTELDHLDADVSTRATASDVVTTLAVSATEAATVASNNVSINQSYTFDQVITSDITDALDAATKIWFCVKTDIREADDKSLVFIEETDGLTVLNKESYATITDGSLTLSGSSGAWVITLKIEESATDLLVWFGTYPMEIKAMVAGDTVYISGGSAVVGRRAVRAIS